MKQYIQGFKQKDLVDLGISLEHIEILYYFKDFVGYKGMKTKTYDKETYYWLSYQKVMEDLPILNIKSRRTIARRFDDLVKAKLLDKYLHKGSSGTFTYFKLSDKYYEMKYKDNVKVDKIEKTLKVKKEKEEESPLFKKFYKAYPKKVNKGQAITTFNKLFKQSVIDNEVVELILKDLERRKRYKQWLKENGNYIPNPSTYLNALAWEDEYVVEAEEIEYVKTEKYVVPEFTKEEEERLKNLDF